MNCPRPCSPELYQDATSSCSTARSIAALRRLLLPTVTAGLCIVAFLAVLGCQVASGHWVAMTPQEANEDLRRGCEEANVICTLRLTDQTPFNIEGAIVTRFTGTVTHRYKGLSARDSVLAFDHPGGKIGRRVQYSADAYKYRVGHEYLAFFFKDYRPTTRNNLWSLYDLTAEVLGDSVRTSGLGTLSVAALTDSLNRYLAVCSIIYQRDRSDVVVRGTVSTMAGFDPKSSIAAQNWSFRVDVAEVLRARVGPPVSPGAELDVLVRPTYHGDRPHTPGTSPLTTVGEDGFYLANWIDGAWVLRPSVYGRWRIRDGQACAESFFGGSGETGTAVDSISVAEAEQRLRE